MVRTFTSFNRHGKPVKMSVPEKAASITTNERLALQAIVDAARAIQRKLRCSDIGPVGYEVETTSCNPFANKKALSGVHSSLSQKGFIQVGFLEDAKGRNHLLTVYITTAGLAALEG